MMFSLKLFAGILIIYFIFCVYFMITSFLEEGSPFKYKSKMYKGKERYVFKSMGFDGELEYWDRKKKRYVKF